MNKHTIYCFVGASGSGKSALVDKIAEKSGMKVLRSYTTRPKRHEDDTDHIYINRNDYFNSVALKNKIATTCINGEFYCATAEQIRESDLYVIDWKGIVKLFKNIHRGLLHDITVKIVYLNTPTITRIWRMIKRRDRITKIIERCISDYNSALSDVEFAKSHADIFLNDRDYKTIEDKAQDFLNIIKIDNSLMN